MRLEQIELGRAEDLLARVMSPSLGNHPALERHLGRIHVIRVVGIVVRVAHHEGRLHLPDDIHETELGILIKLERVIAKIEKLNVGDTQSAGGVLGLLAALGLDPVEGHAFLFPEFRAFPALAVGQADDGDVVALLFVQRDCAAATPDEICGMSTDHEGRLVRHD